jgi:mRNA interferase MazF
MNQGDIVLTAIPQADGQTKNRPALLLRKMPSFNDALVCGISTQLHQYVKDFDEIIALQDEDFLDSGLMADSLIRLGFLTVVPSRKILGTIGSISTVRYQCLIKNLTDYLLDISD